MAMNRIPEVFRCIACLQIRDFWEYAVIVGVRPEDADYMICGMPCKATGFCDRCLGDDE